MPIYTCKRCYYTFEYNYSTESCGESYPHHYPHIQVNSSPRRQQNQQNRQQNQSPNRQQNQQPNRQPFRCPDCGRTTVFSPQPHRMYQPGHTKTRPTFQPAIRPATKAEITDYWRYKKEFDAEEERIVPH